MSQKKNRDSSEEILEAIKEVEETTGAPSEAPKEMKTQAQQQIKTEPQQEMKNLELPPWFEEIRQRLDKLEGEKAKELNKQRALKLLSSSGLPKMLQERWLDRIDLDQKDVETQVRSLELEWMEIQKGTGMSPNTALPLGKSATSDMPAKEEIQSIIDRF